MAITSNDYLKAIKRQYEIEKGKTYSTFLIDPSPAKLRDYCLLLLESEMSDADQVQMSHFFKPKTNETLHKCISGFDLEKLKPIKDFLTGKTLQTNSVNLELIAILVRYQPRPYHIFLKSSQTEKKDEIKEVHFDFMQVDKNSNLSHNTGTIVPINHRLKPKVIMMSLILITIISVGYIAKGAYFPKKQCMQWQEDHYEIVNCEVKGTMNINPIIALDEDVVDLKKVKLKKGMEFFKYKKPLYYYYKVSLDSVEFFNAPGFHPITGKPLNGVTPYMINKYIH